MLRNVASRLTGAVARPLSSGSVASTRTIVTAKLPDLAYDYGALEPVICGEIMALHHAKHHNTYVTNFNIAMEKYAEAEAKGDYATMISLQGAIKFNGGGTLLITHPITGKNFYLQKETLARNLRIPPCPPCS